jgi:hypothetical protein
VSVCSHLHCTLTVFSPLGTLCCDDGSDLTLPPEMVPDGGSQVADDCVGNTCVRRVSRRKPRKK